MAAFYETSRSHIIGGPLDENSVFRNLASRIGHWAFYGYGLWHVDDRRSGDFLGWVGIINGPAWDEPELGWTLFAHAEGKGIAFEAASAARAYGAMHQKLDRVISYIDPDNTRSLALAKRLGATFERKGELLGHDIHVYRHPPSEACA